MIKLLKKPASSSGVNVVHLVIQSVICMFHVDDVCIDSQGVHNEAATRGAIIHKYSSTEEIYMWTI